MGDNEGVVTTLLLITALAVGLAAFYMAMVAYYAVQFYLEGARLSDAINKGFEKVK